MNIHLWNNTSTFSRLAAASVLLLFNVNTWAQDSGWYAGAGAGWADADFMQYNLTNALQTGGYTVQQFSTDDRENAFKIFGGYQYNSFLGLEAGYTDPGKFRFDTNLLPSATQSGQASINGFSVDLVGTLPLQDGFSAFLKAGFINARVKQGFTGDVVGAGFVDASDRSTHEKFGAGLQFAFQDNLRLRAELERYHVGNNPVIKHHVDALTVSVVYRFGAYKRQPVIAERTPPAREPAPRPAPAPAPTPAPPSEVTLSANTLFDFDRAILRQEGRAALDNLVRDMAGLDYEVVIVTGHTDRIGTRSYNLGLSMRRANSVREYLVQAGVPQGRITARGVNSDEPVTRPGQCTGPVSDALKACLQPDRRVVVEVTGTRE